MYGSLLFNARLPLFHKTVLSIFNFQHCWDYLLRLSHLPIFLFLISHHWTARCDLPLVGWRWFSRDICSCMRQKQWLYFCGFFIDIGFDGLQPGKSCATYIVGTLDHLHMEHPNWAQKREGMRNVSCTSSNVHSWGAYTTRDIIIIAQDSLLLK